MSESLRHTRPLEVRLNTAQREWTAAMFTDMVGYSALAHNARPTGRDLFHRPIGG